MHHTTPGPRTLRPIAEIVSDQQRWPMASSYFYASAFVKLLAEEGGSELAAELWGGCDAWALTAGLKRG